ncbi:stage V sporulation protein AD-like protein [Paenibacillus alvei DSM 29]|nr:stage V sporulation protein AD-like protein [Paenibacillus alvei DSM 29]
MQVGRHTWRFQSEPAIIGTATVVGPDEGQGPLAADFDYIHDTLDMEEKSWEKAERKLLEQATQLAIVNSNITQEELNFLSAEIC